MGVPSTASDDEGLRYLVTYVVCLLLHVGLLITSSMQWMLGGVRASRSLYVDTVGMLSRAPMSW